jgi:hypothetical protein
MNIEPAEKRPSVLKLILIQQSSCGIEQVAEKWVFPCETQQAFGKAGVSLSLPQV